MKHEWRKHKKEIYGEKKVARLVTIPIQKFIMISGKGNPSETNFSDKISALYSLAYAIKMGYKKSSKAVAGEIQDFTAYPLEGIWKQTENDKLIKENLEYTIMICQPDFITVEIVHEERERVKIKNLIRYMKKSFLIQCLTKNI